MLSGSKHHSLSVSNSSWDYSFCSQFSDAHGKGRRDDISHTCKARFPLFKVLNPSGNTFSQFLDPCKEISCYHYLNKKNITQHTTCWLLCWITLPTLIIKSNIITIYLLITKVLKTHGTGLPWFFYEMGCIAVPPHPNTWDRMHCRPIPSWHLGQGWHKISQLRHWDTGRTSYPDTEWYPIQVSRGMSCQDLNPCL